MNDRELILVCCLAVPWTACDHMVAGELSNAPDGASSASDNESPCTVYRIPRPTSTNADPAFDWFRSCWQAIDADPNQVPLCSSGTPDPSNDPLGPLQTEVSPSVVRLSGLGRRDGQVFSVIIQRVTDRDTVGVFVSANLLGTPSLLIDTIVPMLWVGGAVSRYPDGEASANSVRLEGGALRISLRGDSLMAPPSACQVRWGLARLRGGYWASTFLDLAAFCQGIQRLGAANGTEIIFEGPVVIPDEAMEELQPLQVQVESEGQAAFFSSSATPTILALGERLTWEVEVTPEALDEFLTAGACE